MSAEKSNRGADGEVVASETATGAPRARKAPYEPPRIEKRRSVARVTLVSGMGQMGVGVIGNMPM
ncbi:MAG TPA: hypothetical protein VM580_26820 [Labilithrix sp.]|nr:hypothetical protein [Labilithrix sp.]